MTYGPEKFRVNQVSPSQVSFTYGLWRPRLGRASNACPWAALLAVTLLVHGCVSSKSTKSRSPSEPVADSSKKPEEPPPAPEATSVKLTPAEEKDLVKLREWVQLKQPLTEADREMLRDPGPTPPPGSTKEALLAMGYVKVVLGRPASGPSLESYGREYQVAIVDAFKSNAYLRGVEGAKMAANALQKVPVSEDFYRQMVAALKVQGSTWAQGEPAVETILPAAPVALGVPFAPAPDLGGGSTSASSPAGTTLPVLGAGADGSRGMTTDQGKIELAQQLADRGLFAEAVLQVQQVSDQSPLKLVAVQKVKEFSQNGIQDLRRKAASAFQNAGVAADDRSRVEYLKTARQYLEDALILFPEAPQASTVRENLKAITLQIKEHHRK
jgi:hypothetical protein